jgi:uncharacterized protein (TIGR03546 family)
MLNQILKFLAALNSGTKPEELALASVIAMFAAFTFSPFNFLFYLFLILILNANTSMFFLMLLFFKAISLAIDPAGDIIGYAVLTAPPLHALFTNLSSLPVAPFTKFNNTLVMGGFIMALIAAAPVWAGTRAFILYYRKNLQAKIEKSKIIKVLNLGGVIDFIKGEVQK